MANREVELIHKGSPCDTNYFDAELLTVEQVKQIGRDICPNYETCQRDSNLCALQLGLQVARYVAKGSKLEKEMDDFSHVPFINDVFWNSVDRRKFSKHQGQAKMLAAVEGFARVILLMDAFESVQERCGECGGVKLAEKVYDSIHDGPFPLSGSGRTRAREVVYCPECQKKPIGGIITEDPIKEIEDDRMFFGGRKP